MVQRRRGFDKVFIPGECSVLYKSGITLASLDRFLIDMAKTSIQDPQLAEFLSRKSPHSRMLFFHLLEAFDEIGLVEAYATKTMVGFRRKRNFSYIIQFGKGFIDMLLPLKEPYEDNLCFRKITMPGDGAYNHHVRIMEVADINEEVRFYMKKAFDLAG